MFVGHAKAIRTYAFIHFRTQNEEFYVKKKERVTLGLYKSPLSQSCHPRVGLCSVVASGPIAPSPSIDARSIILAILICVLLVVISSDLIPTNT